MELLGSALLFGSNASFFHSPCRGFFTIIKTNLHGARMVRHVVLLPMRWHHGSVFWNQSQ
jgi:hypothetical protein